MEIIDVNDLKRKKAPAKLKGGEDFVAEPGLEKPSEEWLDSQAAYLKLTVKTIQGYGNALPQLDGFSSRSGQGYHWDPEAKSYYWKQYISFKVAYRYYRGGKRGSYLFWPKHVEATYTVRQIIDKAEKQLIKVVTDSGTAEYAYLGRLDFKESSYSRPQPILALWKSTGTMKPRRKNERHVTWEEDMRTAIQ